MTQADGAVAEPAIQEAAQAERSPGGDPGSAWFDGVLGRTPIELPSAEVSTPNEDAQSADGQVTSKAAPAENPGEPQALSDSGAAETIAQTVERKAEEQGITLTAQELERRVQAEVDRRETMRLRRQRQQELAKLRDEDPFQYVEEVKKEEEAEQDVAETHQAHRMIYADAVNRFDRAVLDPITLALPEQARSKLLQRDLVTIEDRQAFADAGIKAIQDAAYRRGVNETREKVRKDPTVKKELLAELRAEGVAEPDLVPAANGDGSGRATDMNVLLRRAAGRRS